MEKLIKKTLKFTANNYNSLPIYLKKGKGIYVKDINNKKYIDFLSGYSAINQGHCHPKLVKVMTNQCNNLTLTSRAFQNNKLGEFSEYITNFFNYESFLPMNTGVEAGETAIKLSRKWGYQEKKVENNKAVNIFCNNNFWGRTISAISSSTDINSYKNYGPFLKGFECIEYNNINALEKKLKENPNIVSFMIEPIQGEAGIIIPNKDYLKKVKYLCNKYNVLLIIDEIQTGIGRCGKLLACDYDNIRPDILVLGKSLSGGFYPISGILSSKKLMDNIKPGQHGSTYGGNPLASAIGIEALKIIEEENLIQNSYNMGNYFRDEINRLDLKNIKEIRGKGLFNAIEFKDKKSANKGLYNLLKNGLLTQITHNKIIRLTPPLIINKDQINKSLSIIKNSLL